MPASILIHCPLKTPNASQLVQIKARRRKRLSPLKAHLNSFRPKEWFNPNGSSSSSQMSNCSRLPAKPTAYTRSLPHTLPSSCLTRVNVREQAPKVSAHLHACVKVTIKVMSFDLILICRTTHLFFFTAPDKNKGITNKTAAFQVAFWSPSKVWVQPWPTPPNTQTQTHTYPPAPSQQLSSARRSSRLHTTHTPHCSTPCHLYDGPFLEPLTTDHSTGTGRASGACLRMNLHVWKWSFVFKT